MEFVTLLAPFDRAISAQDHYAKLQRSLRNAVDDLTADGDKDTLDITNGVVDAVHQYLEDVREYAIRAGIADSSPVALIEYPFESDLADTLDGIVLTKRNVTDEVLADTRNDLMVALFYQVVDLYIQYHIRNSRVVGYYHGL